MRFIFDFVEAVENIVAHGWRLRARTLTALNFPVPTLQPVQPNLPIALDLHPSGPAPIESPGNGYTWVDCCDADVMHENAAPVNCARLAMASFAGRRVAVFGHVSFNGAPASWAVVETATLKRWAWNESGHYFPIADNAYQIGSSANRVSVVVTSGGVIQTSDEREKEDIEPTKLGLDYINSLMPVSYRHKNGDGLRHQGLTTQNVLAAANGEPCGVIDGEPMSLNYSELIGPLVKAVQELSGQVSSLKEQCPRC